MDGTMLSSSTSPVRRASESKISTSYLHEKNAPHISRSTTIEGRDSSDKHACHRTTSGYTTTYMMLKL